MTDTMDRVRLHQCTPVEELIFRGIRSAQTQAHEIAKARGWYTDPKTGEPLERNFGEVIALMHSELSEALEADRKGLTADKHLPHRHPIEVEFADTIIRILDTAADRGYDVAGAIIEKMRFNTVRPDHDIKNRQTTGKLY